MTVAAGGDVVPGAPDPKPKPPPGPTPAVGDCPLGPLPPGLDDLVRRAPSGDETAGPHSRHALARHPRLGAALGDIAKRAERELVLLASLGNPLAREALPHWLAAERARLAVDGTTELERLLVERVVLA